MTAPATKLAMGLVCALAACGDAPPAAPPKTQPAAPKVGTPSAEMPGAKEPAKPAAKGAPAQLGGYPKVDDEKYRVNLTREMLAPDPTGDINRDPFRSYVIDDNPGDRGAGDRAPDECDRHLVAGASGLRDLTLTGIVKRGTTAFALFEDNGHEGYIAQRGECISKDKARIKEVGASSVIIQVRGEAPPGAPAPQPREEEWKLHPEEIEANQGGFGALLK